MIPIRPYLSNAVRGYEEETGVRIDTVWPTPEEIHRRYIEWMRKQGVRMPIGADAIKYDDKMIEFTDPKLELIFILRWS